MKRTQRRLQEMGLEAVYPKPRLRLAGAGAQVCSYLLGELDLGCQYLVWVADVAHVPLRGGWVHPVAILG